MRALDTHDTVTDGIKRSETLLGHDGMELVQVMNYVIDGIPMVYCGNELADTAKVNMFANRFYMGEYEVTDRTRKTTPESLRRQEIYKKLNGLRRECQVLQSGTMAWVENSMPEGVISFVRAYNGKKVLFAGNFLDVEAEVSFDIDIAGGKIILGNNCTMLEHGIRMSSRGYVMMEI